MMCKNWYVPISLYVIRLVHRPDWVPDQAVCHRKVPLKLSRVGKGTYSVPAHRTQTWCDLHFLGPYHTNRTTPHPPNLYGSSDLYIIELVTVVRTDQTCQRLCVGQDSTLSATIAFNALSCNLIVTKLPCHFWFVTSFSSLSTWHFRSSFLTVGGCSRLSSTHSYSANLTASLTWTAVQFPSIALQTPEQFVWPGLHNNRF